MSELAGLESRVPRIRSPRDARDRCHELLDDAIRSLAAGDLAGRLSFVSPGRIEDGGPGCFSSVATGREVAIEIASEALVGVPVPALQGWIDLAVARAAGGLRGGGAEFNFRRQILPLLPVTGAAVGFMREIAESLRRSLLRYAATETILEHGRGLPQVYSSFQDLGPSPEEGECYAKMGPAHWIRAAYLTRKLEEYAALDLLAERGVGFAAPLRDCWHEVYAHRTVDRALLGELAAVPRERGDEPFGSRLTEMFRRVRAGLLLRRDPEPAADEGLH